MDELKKLLDEILRRTDPRDSHVFQLRVDWERLQIEAEILRGLQFLFGELVDHGARVERLLEALAYGLPPGSDDEGPGEPEAAPEEPGQTEAPAEAPEAAPEAQKRPRGRPRKKG